MTDDDTTATQPDLVNVVVQSTVLGYEAGQRAEVDRNDERVAAALAGKHFVLEDDKDGRDDQPDSLTGVVTAPEPDGGDTTADVLEVYGLDAADLAAPTATVAKLRQAGVEFTEDQADRIAFLEGDGEVQAAADLVLAELRAQLG